ncbi:MAG: toll/interleukin-1 receptor domain-containing protein, partial [Cyclobacteriaceae bacterium]
MISLIRKDDQFQVKLNCDNNYNSDFALSTLITSRVFEESNKSGLLDKVLIPDKVIRYDIPNDTLALNTSAIPHEYPLFKHFFTRMCMVDIDNRIKGRLLVKKIYKPYFSRSLIKEVMGNNISIGIESEQNLLMNEKSNSPGVKIFISYAHKDEIFKDELIEHLSGLIQDGTIEEWDDRMISPGEKWDNTIRLHLESARVVLFLVSSSFMASEYINDVEVSNTLK